ncbi:MAG TPA: hypothetical protein VGL95_03345 [Acetobacteraceae bacterium]|jgi:hypothetical protein
MAVLRPNGHFLWRHGGACRSRACAAASYSLAPDQAAADFLDESSNDGCGNTAVIVAEHVADIRHLLPPDPRMPGFQFVGQMAADRGDNFDGTLNLSAAGQMRSLLPLFDGGASRRRRLGVRQVMTP